MGARDCSSLSDHLPGFHRWMKEKRGAHLHYLEVHPPGRLGGAGDERFCWVQGWRVVTPNMVRAFVRAQEIHRPRVAEVWGQLIRQPNCHALMDLWPQVINAMAEIGDAWIRPPPSVGAESEEDRQRLNMLMYLEDNEMTAMDSYRPWPLELVDGVVVIRETPLLDLLRPTPMYGEK
jgi:hypothetical protein